MKCLIKCPERGGGAKNRRPPPPLLPRAQRLNALDSDISLVEAPDLPWYNDCRHVGTFYQYRLFFFISDESAILILGALMREGRGGGGGGGGDRMSRAQLAGKDKTFAI